MATAASVLVIAAFGAPASAVPGKGAIAVVNGMPGVKVDICINGKEIKSGARYGSKIFKRMTAGKKVLKIYKRDPRTCRGTRLARRSFVLTGDSDLTLVATRKAPRVIVFDNVGLGAISASGSGSSAVFVAWRHAADLGGVNFKGTSVVIDPEFPIDPTADAIWRKSDEAVDQLDSITAMWLRATRPEKTKTVAKSALVTLKSGRRYEWYLLGTKVRNAKFVVFSRAVS